MLENLPDHAEVASWQAILDDIQALKADAFAGKGTRVVLNDLWNNVYSKIFYARFLYDAASDVKITAAEVDDAAKSFLAYKGNQPGAILLGYGSAGTASGIESLLLISTPCISGVNA
jgi:hypothetical protein